MNSDFYQIRVYDKQGAYCYAMPNEYTSDELAYERAEKLNEFWQSDDRAIKGDKLYATTQEQLNETLQKYQQQHAVVSTPVPRQPRRVQLERRTLRAVG